MRKNWKRLLALFLATAMVVASGVFTTYAPFRATDTDAYTENLNESTETVDLASDETGNVLIEEPAGVETTEELSVTEEGEEVATPAEETSEEVSEATEEEMVADDASVTEEDEITKPKEEEEKEEVAEAEEEDEEEEEEEETYPPLSYATTTATGVQVVIDAPKGAFPDGTTVTVSDVTNPATIAAIEGTAAEDQVVTSVVAVDITFRDKEGHEIEPLTAIAVRIIPQSALAGEEFSVVHVEDNGSATKVEDASATGASFETDAFSTYAVMGTEGARVLQEGEYEVSVDDQITITSSKVSSSTWSTNSDAVSLSSKRSGSVIVTGNYEGTATITHGTGNKKETFTVYVNAFEDTIILEVGGSTTFERGSSSESSSSEDTGVASVYDYRSGGFISGYTYYTDVTAEGPGRTTVVVKNGSKVYARYYITVTGTKTVVASFNLNGGSGSIADITAEIPEGETYTTVTLPEAPARSGYKFLGWAESANASGIAYYAGQDVELTASKTFYAVWQKTSGQIQFMKCTAAGTSYRYSADGSAINVANLGDEYTITKANPTYSGYTFYGWSAQVEPNTSYAFVNNREDFIPVGKTVIIPRNYMDAGEEVLKLYPVFVYNDAMLTIAVRRDGQIPQEPKINNDPYDYFAGGGSNRDKVVTSKYLNPPYAYFGNDAGMQAILKSEMFDPDRTDVPGNIYNLDSTIVDPTEQYIDFYICKYQFNDRTYHLDGTKRDRERSAYLDYNVNGGQNKPASQTTTIGGTLTVSPTTLSDGKVVSRTGYKFKEWNTSQDGHGTAYAPGSEITLTADILDEYNRVILYAQWIPNSDTVYTVQWMDRYDDSVIKEESRSGETVSIASVEDADKVLNNYTFDAENPGNVLEGRILPDGSLVLKLYFYQTVTVSYEDTMESGVELPPSATVEKGRNYTVEGNEADFSHTINGYTFLGWSEDRNATVETYHPGDVITNVLTNTKLYAIWAKTGTIRYGYDLVLPGATWSTPAGFVADGTVYYNSVDANSGDIFTVTSNVPSAGGYAFVGWADRGARKLRTAGDIIILSNECILEALWVKTTGNDATVTYDGNNHSLDAFDYVINAADDAYINVESVTYRVAGSAAVDSSATLPAFKNAGTYVYEATYVVNGTSITRYGTLTINKANVTVTGADAEKDYDGKPLKAEVVKPAMTAEGFFGDDAITEYTYSGSQTLVGSSTYIATPKTYSNDMVPNNYNITVSGGTLRVNGATDPELRYQIILNGTTGNATYNGLNQEHSGLTASGNLNLDANDGFFDRFITSFTGNVTYTFDVTDENGVAETYTIKVREESIKVSGKDAGTYAYTPAILSIVDSNNNNAADLFNVTANPGAFTINPAAITITSGDGEKTYDGTPLTNSDITVTGLVNNETLTATATGSITYQGQTANTIVVVWDGSAKESNYTVTKNEGQLVINSNSSGIQLSITANNGEGYYNGEAQTVTGFVGQTTRTIGGESVTVVPATVNIGGTNRTYYIVGASAVAEGTDAGTYTTAITTSGAKIYDEAGVDVTGEFNVKGTVGTLTINKRQVTITSASDSKTYDGSALTNETIASQTAYDASGNGFVEGEGVASYTFTYEDGQAIYAGDAKSNTFNYTLQSNTKADNYIITKVPGTLVINSAAGAYEVTVTASDLNAKYDGTTQTIENAIENMGADGRIAVTYNGATYYISGYSAKAEGKNAGTYANALTGTGVKVYDAAGREVTENFTITPKNGTFTIGKRSVTLTGEALSKPYDGTPLVAREENIIVGGDGWAAGEGVIYAFSGSQTLVGQSDYTFTYTQKEGTDLATNYDVTANGNTLEVTINEDLKYQITVNGHNGTRTYDGTPYDVTGFDVNGEETSVSFVNWMSNSIFSTDDISGTFTLRAGGEEKNFTISIPKDKVTATQTDVGTANYGWKVSDITIKEGTKDVTDQFEIILDGGSATVEKRAVTMTSATAEKVYDGTPLTKYEVTVGGDGFADGEGATYEITGTVTDPNQAVENTFTYNLANGTKASNYDITTIYGTLRILPRGADDLMQATIYANGKETKYDGSEQSVSGFVGEEDGVVTVTVGEQAYEISGYTVGASGTNAGDYETTYSGNLLVRSKATGANVTDQFNVTVVSATLAIAKRDITLTSASATKNYDGNPLTKHEIIVGGDGYAGTETFAYNFTGSRVIQGVSENTFTYADDTAKAINYNVTTSNGTLTIVELSGDERYSVTLRAGSAEYEYDGTEKVVDYFANGINVNDNGDVLVTFNEHNYRITGYSVYTSLTNAGEVATNVVTSARPVVYDEDNNDVSTNFAINTAPGRLEVSKRQVTLKSEGGVKEYDGSPLVNANVTATNLIPNNNDITSIQAVGRQVYVGSSANTILYALRTDVADNYDIHVVEGTLTVNNRSAKYEITVTAGSVEKTYDGEAAAVNDYTADTLTFDGKKYTLSGLSVEASRTDAGTTVTQVVGDPVITDRANKVVTDQFTVTRIPGAITINPKELTLKSATLTKEYDGEPLTNGETGLEVESGWVSGEGATYTFGASQTIVGTTTNTFNIVPNEGTKLSNYNVQKTEGSLNVTNRDAAYAVTITARSRNNLVYDGSEIVVDTFIGQESKNDRIPVEASNGKTYYVADVVAYGSRTDAGTATVEVSGTPAVYDAATAGNDVSEQFAVTMETGVITINPSPVTITGNDIEKKYTGMAVVPTMDDVTIGSGFVGEDGIESITFSGSRTLIGTSPYEITEWTFKEGTNPANYDVTATGANITVIDNDEIQYEITIGGVAAGNGSIREKVYDGNELVVTGYTVNAEVTNTTFGNWIANHLTDTQNVESSFTLTTPDGNAETFVVSIPKDKVTARQTDVGVDSYQWQKSDVTITNKGVDVTNQFMIQLEPVTATVTPATITLTSGTTLDFLYDGKPHQNKVMTFNGLIENDVPQVVFSFDGFPSVTDVGEVKSNTFTASISGEKAKNYTLEIVPGQIGVIARPLDDLLESTTIYAKSGGGTYNGQQQSVSGWQYAVNDLIEFNYNGLKYYVDVANLPVGATGTNVSDSKETTYSGSYRIVDSKGTIVTDQFKPVTMNMGTLKIDPVALTITSASGERGYNGNVYRLDEANVTSGAFVGEEGATYNFTGGRVKLGSVENTFNYTLKPNTLAENYDITTAFGTLNVINEAGAFDVTVTAASDSILYDGTTYAINSFAAGVDEDATVDGIQTTIDGNTYTITGLSVYQSAKDATEGLNVNVTGTPVVTDDAGNNVTDSFTVHVASGKLVINKRNVTMTSPDKTYTYDGNVHTISDDEIIVGGDGWAAGEGVTYTKTSIQNVGTKTNAFTYTMVGETKPANYNITTTEGTLEVVDTGIDPELVVDKVIDDATTIYDEGDEVTYTITVTNIYDTPQDITLTEQAGVTLDQSTFTNVAPGQQVVAHASYTITSADIVAGTYENTVTVDFPGVGKTYSDTEGSAPIAAEDADVTVTKVLSAINGVAVTPGASVIVKVGDELTYTINAINNGNVDLNNVIVSDELTGDSWTIGTLPARSISADYNATYKVTAADAVAGYVRNTAKVETTGDDSYDDPTDPSDDIDVDVTVDQNFKVTIHFVNIVGATVYPDYVATYRVGDTFTIVSPEVEGYTPSVASIASPVGGMPAQDIELTVIYSLTPTTTPAAGETPTAPTTPTTPTTPTGEGATPATPAGEAAPAAPAVAQGAGNAGNLFAVDEPQAPLAQMEVGNDGRVTLIPIDDMMTPLANNGLGILFNALYFLLLVASAVTLSAYSKSMKKHQLRIQRYEKQLGKRE